MLLHPPCAAFLVATALLVANNLLLLLLGFHCTTCFPAFIPRCYSSNNCTHSVVKKNPTVVNATRAYTLNPCFKSLTQDRGTERNNGLCVSIYEPLSVCSKRWQKRSPFFNKYQGKRHSRVRPDSYPSWLICLQYVVISRTSEENHKYC